jgi:hypothetical protein
MPASQDRDVPWKPAGKPRYFTVDDVYSEDSDLPEKMELISGVLGPFSDKAILTLLTNWGADMSRRAERAGDRARGDRGAGRQGRRKIGPDGHAIVA